MKKVMMLAALALTTTGMFAQQKQGRWTLYPTVASEFGKVMETPDKVFGFAGNTLVSQSNKDNEYYVYSVANKLTDGSPVEKVFTAADGHAVALAYTNGNIDIVYADGRTVNLPEVRDAIVSTYHHIRSINFGEGYIVVGTQFGVVLYNEAKAEVKASAITNAEVQDAWVAGGNLVIRTYPDRKVYFAPLSSRINSLASFTEIGAIWGAEIIPVSGNKVLIVHDTDRKVRCFDLDFATKTIDNETVAENNKNGLFYSPKGVVSYNSADNKLYLIGLDGVQKSSVTLPAEWKNKNFLGFDGLDHAWITDGNTAAKYAIAAPATAVARLIQPMGCTVPIAHAAQAADGKVFFSNVSQNFIYETSNDNYFTGAYLDMIDENGVAHDWSVENPAQYVGKIKDYDRDDRNGRVAATGRFSINPKDPAMYALSSNRCGTFIIKDRKIVAVFNKLNGVTPTGFWLHRIYESAFDKDGNLWVGQAYQAGSDPCYGVLSAEKMLNPTAVTRADWTLYKANEILGYDQWLERDHKLLHCEKSTAKVLIVGDQCLGFSIFDDNGTPFDKTDDKRTYYSGVTDTEGNSWNLNMTLNAREDRNGAVWVGTDHGLFIIQDPAAAAAGTVRVKRPIVARNDGTNLGDYLLEAESIYDIAVDPSNRKWLATGSSGVYLVSADGTRILNHFTTENSPLPSNTVYSAVADPNSNKVYFGTTQGIACHDSDSAPAEENYDNVYAYPNPVRPDYTGWINIAGLMDGSLVKIADMAGNVVSSGRAEGGMYAWDGCTPTGERVSTGVYLVLASSSENGSEQGVVTKIMVVN